MEPNEVSASDIANTALADGDVIGNNVGNIQVGVNQTQWDVNPADLGLVANPEG